MNEQETLALLFLEFILATLGDVKLEITTTSSRKDFHCKSRTFTLLELPDSFGPLFGCVMQEILRKLIHE